MDIIKPNPIANAVGAVFSRASTGTYRDRDGVLQVAAANVPRFDHDPATGVCRLLVEAAATNLFLNSGDMALQDIGANLSYAGAVDGPLGKKAVRFVSALNSDSFARQSVSVAAKGVYTFRYWLRLPSGVPAGTFYVQDLANGNAIWPISVAATTEWQRVAVTFTMGPSAGIVMLHVGAVDSPNGYVFEVALGQLEAGAVATSDVPTGNTPATRAADVIPAGLQFVTSMAEDDYAPWAPGTLYSAGDRCISSTTHKVYESLRGAKSAVTVSVASPAVVTWLKHGLAASTRVRFSTTGALPTGLSAGTDYYVVAAGLTADSFSVSATAGGAAIATTGASAGVHTVREVVNLNIDPTVAANTVDGTQKTVDATTQWLEVGCTNVWRMFDSRVSDQTTAPSAIEFAILPGQISALGLCNLGASVASVAIDDPDDGSVYARLFDLTAANVFDWSDYFFKPVIRKSDFVVDNLPAYPSGIVTVSLRAESGTAACGEVVPGMLQNLGDAQWGAKVGRTSFSKKTTDDYGNRDLKKGASSKRMSIDVFIEDEDVDEVEHILANLDATGVLWIGDKNRTSTINFGFYTDYDVVLQTPAGSFCSIEIEGL